MKTQYNVDMLEMGIRGKLIEIKNQQYSELDRLIWDKRKEFADWNERFEAIRSNFNEMLGQMANAIDEHLEKIEQEKPDI